MSNRVEVVIGNKGADHVSLQIMRHDPEGWSGANIEVRCNHLAAKINGTFRKGELSRFAQQIRRLWDDLSGTAQLQPLEPNIELTLKGDGKGHIIVEGVARQDFHTENKLIFCFTIDQTYLNGIAHSFDDADPEMAIPLMISEYDRLLEKTQEALNARHCDSWVEVLRGWRAELKSIDNATLLGSHAARTARALGGMGSIGDIALTDRDSDFLKLVDDLYKKCKELISE